MRIVSRALWLTGPIFDKELRVTSRRRRYYLLRCAYVGLLCVVIFEFWHTIAHIGGGTSNVVQVSRLGGAGKRVIVSIVWFQFIAGQILATVLLSDAVNGEIRRRTLENLLVTPVRAIHIVWGKLLSRLLLLVLLLAASLPVLALARVFGGVPWDYVVAGLCITLTAMVFAGSLSLLCSILYRHAYRAVLTVGFWYLVLWGLDALVLIALPRTGYVGNSTGALLWSLISPLHALLVRTRMVLGGPSSASPCVSLTLHCLTVLGAAAIILILSARRVRGMTQAVPQGHAETGAQDAAMQRTDWWTAIRAEREGEPIRRVKGSPIVWKDLGTSLFQRSNQALLDLGLWLIVGALALVAVILAKPATYGSFFLPILIVQWVFIIRLALSAAGAITREKEARTWPVLLTTPLDDRQIVRGKALGALRRNLPLVVPLLAFYLLAFWFGRPGEWRLSHLVLGVGIPTANLLGTILFLLGVGLYAGIRCRTTTAAVVATLSVYFLVKFAFCVPPTLLPMALMGMLPMDFTNDRRDFAYMALFAICYACGGLVYLRTAAHRVRRDVF